MSINFKSENAYVDNDQLQLTNIRVRGDILKSDELTGIEVRLSRALIKNNGTIKIPPFPGLAQMYLLIIVISDVGIIDPNLTLKAFSKVDDMEELPVDRTIFYWKKETSEVKNPGQIHCFVSVIKSKERLRETSEILKQVKGDNDYSDLVNGLQTMLSTVNIVSQVADMLFNLASVVGKHLGNVKDKPLLTWVQSFTDINGDLDTTGKLVKEKENDNAALALTLIVRDKNRENKIIDDQSPEVKAELQIDEH